MARCEAPDECSAEPRTNTSNDCNWVGRIVHTWFTYESLVAILSYSTGLVASIST
ncbi:MAG TPA: hypothetical protein VEJ86_12320 [Candidatus Binataceae bacterium]|nr:hypothetical protein [Candidatus Binataceae bacterium]